MKSPPYRFNSYWQIQFLYDFSQGDIRLFLLRQSFKPGEVTPELANKIGYDLAMSLTKGKRAFIVCTHVDKEHIHSHFAVLKGLGVEVKRGKHLAFKIPGGKRFVRCDSLGEDYSEAAILERIDRKRIVAPKQKEPAPSLLIDIQAKLQQAHSPGFELWASVFNLKEMAKTMNYLQEHGLLAYPDLEAACDAAAKTYHDFSDRTKANEPRMKEIAELQKHIGAYGKNRDVYAQYRKLPPKKREFFYAEHASAIISCEAAKRFFDSLGLKKLPSMQSLKQEYAALEAENKKLYPDQKKARAEMMELLTVKHNTSRILGLTEDEKRREQHQEER